MRSRATQQSCRFNILSATFPTPSNTARRTKRSCCWGFLAVSIENVRVIIHGADWCTFPHAVFFRWRRRLVRLRHTKASSSPAPSPSLHSPAFSQIWGNGLVAVRCLHTRWRFSHQFHRVRPVAGDEYLRFDLIYVTQAETLLLEDEPCKVDREAMLHLSAQR
jgi:hypothetical protein